MLIQLFREADGAAVVIGVLAGAVVGFWVGMAAWAVAERRKGADLRRWDRELKTVEIKELVKVMKGRDAS